MANTGRFTGSVSALGTLTVALAFLTILSSARADELADLRANQELLQRRIDQLAQVSEAGTKAVPGAPLAGGSFPRSFIIPGTETSLRVGGEVRLSVDYLLSGGGQNVNGVPTNTIGVSGLLEGTPLDIHGQTVPGLPTLGNVVPVNLQHSRSHFVVFTPRETRINLETRTPTAWGEASTVLEFDFNGAGTPTREAQVSSSFIARVRHAYATLGPLLVGQTYPFLYDVSTHPDVLDFGGEVGTFGPSRHPQIRYTGSFPFVAGGAFAAELVQPDTDIRTAVGKFNTTSTDTPTTGSVNPAGGIINPAESPAPDLILGLQYDNPVSHMRLGAVVRDLQFQDGRFFDKQFVGYGGAWLGWVKPGWFGWERDQISWNAGGGEGIGRWVEGGDTDGLQTNYGAFSITTAAAAARVIVQPVLGWGATIAYEHYWLPNCVRTSAPASGISITTRR